jgi:hypothetical protein
MSKIWKWLTGGVIKDVGKVIDDLVTSDEEKLLIKERVTSILEEANKAAQEQVTKRWEVDMKSDSWLSKNIRPLVLIYMTAMFTIISCMDGNIGQFKITEAYIPIYQSLLITVYGAYFLSRGVEKIKNTKK